MQNKIFVIEGTDGCGKQTQSIRLVERLRCLGYETKLQSFPNYSSASSGALKMYLGGELSDKADGVNPFAASILFEADRICTMIEYNDFLQSGGVLVLDRYMESNFIHQGVKFQTNEEKIFYEKFLSKLDYEFVKIPKPACVFFLNMPPDVSKKLRENRGVLKSGEKKDIHEQDEEYMKKAYLHGLEVAKRNAWKIIDCVENGSIKSIDEISNEIFAVVQGYLK